MAKPLIRRSFQHTSLANVVVNEKPGNLAPLLGVLL
jgi:hypothetical protein